MSELRVFHDHQLLATYPDDHQAVMQPDGSLQIVQLIPGPGGTVTQQPVGVPYPAGTWHGATTLPCAYLTPSTTCPRCNGVPAAPA